MGRDGGDRVVGGESQAVGVCNFEPRHLKLLADRGGLLPAVDQVELHPHLPQTDIRATAAELGIAVESWSPLGGTSGSGWGSGVQAEHAAHRSDHHANRRSAQQDAGAGPDPVAPAERLIVIPKSVHEDRIAQNIDVFDFELSELDLSEIATLDDGTRVGMHPDEMNLGAP